MFGVYAEVGDKKEGEAEGGYDGVDIDELSAELIGDGADGTMATTNAQDAFLSLVKTALTLSWNVEYKETEAMV